mmetsp:Transcript_6890/g.11119  ORF Transcript_6890/g.11119 Transcript_6890/m.11119 type:complete len:106 (-) Transcript_6890:78-395(-)
MGSACCKPSDDGVVEETVGESQTLSRLDQQLHFDVDAASRMYPMQDSKQVFSPPGSAPGSGHLVNGQLVNGVQNGGRDAELLGVVDDRCVSLEELDADLGFARMR